MKLREFKRKMGKAYTMEERKAIFYQAVAKLNEEDFDKFIRWMTINIKSL